MLSSCVFAQTTSPAKISPDTPPEQLEVSQLDVANGFLGRGFFDLALVEYQKYLEWFPSGFAVEEVQYRMAESHRGLGNKEKARELYKKTQKNFPKGKFFARASFRLGEMEWDEKKWEKALEFFHESAERAESSETRLTSRFYEARALIQLNRKAKATPVLEELTRTEKQNPYRGFALLELAKHKEATGLANEACVMFSKVLETESPAPLKAEAALRAGILQMKAKQWAAAATLFEKVRSLKTSGDWKSLASLYLVRTYYQSDQYVSVLRIVNDSKSLFPKESLSETDLIQAHSLRQLKRYKEAVQAYEQLLVKHPKHSSLDSVLYEKLMCRVALKDPKWIEEAVHFLKKFPTHPQVSWVIYLQADHAFRTKDFASAVTKYNVLSLEKIEKSYIPEIMYRHGFALLQIEKYVEAEKKLGEFLTQFPNHIYSDAAWFQKGVAQERLKDFHAASVSYQELVDQFPKAPNREVALYRIALLDGELKQYSKMRKTFERLLKEYNQTQYASDAAYWMGWSFFEEKKYQEALGPLEQARKLNTAGYGSQSTTRIILSNYYLKQRRPLIKEIDLLPPTSALLSPEIYNWVAQESDRESDDSSAERYYRKLLVHPEAKAFSQSARWGLATSLASQSKWKEAVDLYEAYEKDFPDPESVIAAKLQLVRGYSAIEEFKLAEETAEEILRLQPEGKNNAEARFRLAETMQQQKKFMEAGKYFLSVALLYEDPEMTPRSLSLAVKAFELGGDTNQVVRLREELEKKYPKYTHPSK
jgi:TolA-binding protein